MSAPMIERSPHGAATRAAGTTTGGSSRRVLIATDTFPPDVNGASFFTSRLACGLAARAHEVHVVCQSSSGRPGTERLDGITVHRLRSAPLLVHPTMRVTLPVGLRGTIGRLIERIEPDVLHIQGHLVVGRAAISAARRVGLGIVATNHFMPDNLLPYAPLPARLGAAAARLAWRDLVRVFGRADHVTTPTQIAASLLVDQGCTFPVEPVSCGIDLARFHPSDRPKAWARERLGLPERPTVLFVGRLDAEKRLEEVVRALAMVLNDTDAQVALVGTGSRRDDLERLAGWIGVGERVRFLGFVPDDRLPLAYAAADVFVMPGVAELQSIATLEAMASGLPVVAADALALPHLVRPGENGYLYRPGDVPALAGRLTELLAAPRLARTMGEAGRAIAVTHDHERSLDRFEQIYSQVQNMVQNQVWTQANAQANARVDAQANARVLAGRQVRR
jgi:glycosyltransferase involved in cell wall biosynthesis